MVRNCLPSSKNLLHSLRLIIRMQRCLGLFPYAPAAEYTQLQLTACTFLRTMIVPTLYACATVLNAYGSSFQMAGSELQLFARIFGECFFWALIFCANYKCHLQLEFFQHLQAVDARMEQRLRIRVDHRRLFRATVLGCSGLFSLACIRLTGWFRSYKMVWLLTKASEIVAMFVNTGNALAYFMCLYAILIRTEQLTGYVQRCCLNGKAARLAGEAEREQLFLDMCEVHHVLRNGVAEMNEMNAKRVVLTYFREGMTVTLQVYYMYSALIGTGVLMPMTTLAISVSLGCAMISTLCFYCHKTIMYVSAMTWLFSRRRI